MPLIEITKLFSVRLCQGLTLCLMENRPAGAQAAHMGTQVGGSCWAPTVHGYLRPGTQWVHKICLRNE